MELTATFNQVDFKGTESLNEEYRKNVLHREEQIKKFLEKNGVLEKNINDYILDIYPNGKIKLYKKVFIDEGEI